jgi:amino acid permease
VGNSVISYWQWFFKGSGAKPGYRRLVNRWILLHLCAGGIVAFLTQIDLQTAANTVLLPLVGILIGLSFAWAGNAQALLQSSEIDKLSEHHEGGFVEYVFTYQTAILAILITLVFWGLAGLHIFDTRWPTSQSSVAYFVVKTFLFLLVSMTLRECWHVVMGAQWLLLVQREIRKHNRNQEGRREK